MGGHESHETWFLNLGLDGRDFMINFHIILYCCGLGFDPETKSFQVLWLVDG